jgi:hypothetical protein
MKIGLFNTSRISIKPSLGLSVDGGDYPVFLHDWNKGLKGIYHYTNGIVVIRMI